MIKIYEHTFSREDKEIATLLDKSILPVLVKDNTITIDNKLYLIASVNTVMNFDWEKEDYQINVQVIKL